MEMIDHFAEYLSQHDASRGRPGGDVATAAARLGQTEAWGRRMLRRLTDRLGDQAR